MCVTQRFVLTARRHIGVTLLITHMCVQVDYQLSVIIDYSYYQLLLSIAVDCPYMCFICVQVNMCDILLL